MASQQLGTATIVPQLGLQRRVIEVRIKGITPLTFLACGLLFWGLRGQPLQPARSSGTQPTASG